jgi:CubicO group peptidase (beta-lactamase class C family)
MTYGFLLGEIIRRVDGRGPAQFFYEEIGDKAGIDLQIGLRSPAERDRLAEIGSLEPLVWPPTDPVSDRVSMSLEAVDWSAWQLAAEVPAVGYANGRSLARICAIGAMRGELDGTRYLSPEIIDEACRRQAYTELLLFSPGALGLGFGVPSEAFQTPTPTCAHWGGFGGSQWLFDPASGVSYGYAMNNMILNAEKNRDLRWRRLWDALGEVMAAL